VPDGVDRGTFIPITIVHGARPGPVLALVAGVHGSEYSPILALQALAPRLDPKEIRGTVVLVQVANIPAFLGRTVYTGPIDGKNLNRSYPGRADGSVSERIADVITNDVIRRTDFVVDVHSGDANEDLHRLDRDCSRQAVVRRRVRRIGAGRSDRIRPHRGQRAEAVAAPRHAAGRRETG
jgi:predicted deacylase